MNKETLTQNQPESEVQESGMVDEAVQPVDYVAKFDKLHSDFSKVGGASEECRAYLIQACRALMGAARTVEKQGGYNNDGVISKFLSLLA